MASIERAKPADRPAIEAVLVSNDLPLDGLELALPLAVVARDGASLAGCAAVEAYGRAGLLRSVVVAESVRGTGVGRALVEAAEALAAEAGIRDLYLLTETAEAWFSRLGYERVTRADVPADLLASPEFASVCPESSAVMLKRLGVAAGNRRD
jgi:amino-acid N-acetyltransferase